ncbi:SDR family oxidoreductase [Pseudomonas sp. EYE_354]|uniref:dTDP-4-dehydrorhamnose reductase family protein n=1 Tax=Pseudomonas sp. EYE_354 TaxID=2853449 RepID=UPI002002D0E8|nr:SDR family oxidoreductase [Pseudomonas sp. EYE_354]MCK6186796.1 SDR family oxidoreductase [Pseudomonas sp. EYE_354]
MRVLVLGVTGMLGSSVFNELSLDKRYNVNGTLRNADGLKYFDEKLHPNLITNVDVLDIEQLLNVFIKIKPDVVINCVGLIKQFATSKDPLVAIPLNALLPHRLLKLCELCGSRLVHISTDCVFSGRSGGYIETDQSDAEDLYGRSKFIGEVTDSKNAITLRTSIIGHELNSKNSLVDWFLSQQGTVKGYSNAVFSGLPTVELAAVIRDYVLPDNSVYGLYHVSSDAIDKLALLRLIAKNYQKDVVLIPDDSVKIDRSLDSSKFRSIMGYNPPSWDVLVSKMRATM